MSAIVTRLTWRLWQVISTGARCKFTLSDKKNKQSSSFTPHSSPFLRVFRRKWRPEFKLLNEEVQPSTQQCLHRQWKFRFLVPPFISRLTRNKESFWQEKPFWFATRLTSKKNSLLIKCFAEAKCQSQSRFLHLCMGYVLLNGIFCQY